MDLIERKINLLRCPDCKCNNLMQESSEYLRCGKCNEKYRILSKNVVDLLSNKNLSDVKRNIQRFWGDTYMQWYSKLDKDIDRNTLVEHLDYLEDMFFKKRHLAAIEIELDKISNLDILEIGSGGGGHSALFQKHGADVVAIDITLERVLSTAKKMALLNKEKGIAFTADAENLPFHNDSFDIVYSNGVLHHTEDTEKCIEEVRRVLKPNGKAVIMLYSRHSALYWLNLILKGVIKGLVFRYPEYRWLGYLTEGKPKLGEERNPVTRLFSKEQLVCLFDKFQIQSLRKHSFNFDQLPLVGKWRLRERIMKFFGYTQHPGGVIVYGSPHMCESKIELILSPYIGFNWNIVALKKTYKDL